MTTGYGGPNYVLQRYFKDFLDKKEFNADRAALLKNVLTDAYFRGLRDPKDATDPDPYKPESKGISVAGSLGPNPGSGSGSGIGGFAGIGCPPEEVWNGIPRRRPPIVWWRYRNGIPRRWWLEVWRR